MLIDLGLIVKLLDGIEIKGALHIGAHECEELPFYKEKLNISDENIIWIEAINSKVLELKNRNVLNVYNSVITDKDDEIVTFNITNNIESSSVLEFETHSIHHPTINVINKINVSTVTVDTFFDRNGLDAKDFHFWNLDIQGAELLALKGATKSIRNAKAIYLEVNEEHLYKDCSLIGEIDEYLSTYGFVRIVTKITDYKWGDALYIHSRYFTRDIVKILYEENIKPNIENRINTPEYIFYINLSNTFKTIFDIGCQDNSIYTNFNGEVHYFEPVKKLLVNLKNKSTNNSKPYYNNFLISNKRIYNETNNNLNSAYTSGYFYMNELNILKIELLSINMQNFELNILQSFGTYLRRIKIVQINYEGSHEQLLEIINYLRTNGFSNFSYLTINGPESINTIVSPCKIVSINNNYNK